MAVRIVNQVNDCFAIACDDSNQERLPAIVSTYSLVKFPRQLNCVAVLWIQIV